MKNVVIKVNKIKNIDEAEKLEKDLKKDINIKRVIVDEKNNTIETFYENLTISQIEEKIEELGYVSLGIDLTPNTKKKSKPLLIVLGVFLFIILFLSISSLLKLPFTNIINVKVKAIILFIITILFMIYGNNIFIKGITGKSKLCRLLTISIIPSFIYSTYNLYTFLGNKSTCNNYTYLEIIIFLIYFKKIGEYLVSSNVNRIDTEIKQLTNTTIHKVNVRFSDKIREMSIENVKVDDRVVCYPGDLILLDGTVTKGYSHTAEALINGKSLPLEKEENTIVLSGSMNCEDELEYRVDRASKDSYISNIKKLVIDEKNNKKSVTKKVDKYCGILIPLVIILGLTVGILNYLVTKDISTSITKAITILLIFSPFGLVISSAISFRRTIKSPANKGILIKNIKSLEQFKYIDTIVFDKTGTLTNGYLSISRINNHSEMTDKELLELLGSIEKHSTHAIARGISKYLRSERIKSSFDFITEDLFGYGVKAKDDKDLYYACNSELLKKLDIINSYKEEERKMKLDGNNVIYLVKNNKVIATFGLRDTVRKDVVKVINSLRERKLDIVMITGDDKEQAERVSKELGIKKVVCDLNPLEKSEYIKKLMKSGKKVLMVGDGINDAISLACADISISLKNSLDIPTAASDIIITNNNLFKILDLFHVSKSTTKLLKENVFLSLIPSILLFILAIGVIPKIKINSVIIIIGLFISFILVLLNTFRVKNK